MFLKQSRQPSVPSCLRSQVQALQDGTSSRLVLPRPPDQNTLCLDVYVLWQASVALLGMASTPGPPGLL